MSLIKDLFTSDSPPALPISPCLFQRTGKNAAANYNAFVLKDAESRGGEVNQDAVVRDNKRAFFGLWFPHLLGVPGVGGIARCETRKPL
jgi:hypothetical protein